MRKSDSLLCYLGIFIFLGINPGACSRSCGKAATRETTENLGKQADNLGSKADDPPKYIDNTAPLSDDAVKHPGDNAVIQSEESTFGAKKVTRNFDGSYTYNNRKYDRFDEIPFQSYEDIALDQSLTSQQVEYLMNRGVKFFYNNSALYQRDKNFRIIYMMSDNIDIIKNLYDLDDAYAEKLKTWSSKLADNDWVRRVATYDDMIAAQNEVLAKNEVPVLVFHNNVDQALIARFDYRTNYITCNSFNISPNSYLTSTDLLDIQGIIEALNVSWYQGSLGTFYKSFTEKYYAHMQVQHRQKTLMYIAGGGALGGGTYAIAYYNESSN